MHDERLLATVRKSERKEIRITICEFKVRIRTWFLDRTSGECGLVRKAVDFPAAIVGEITTALAKGGAPMSEVFDFPRSLPRDARGKILPVVEMRDHGRHADPILYVILLEIHGGWSSHEYIGNRHWDALAAIDRVKREREIGDVEYIRDGEGD